MFAGSLSKWVRTIVVLLAAGMSSSLDAGDTRRNLLYWPKEKSAVTVKLEFGGNLLFAKVSINEQPAGWFMIDTGASYIAVDADVAKRLNLPRTGKAEAIGVAGSQDATIHRVKSISLGEASLRNRNVLAIDFGDWSKLLGIELAGVLGYDLWSQVPFSLDYQTATLTFYDPDKFEPNTESHVEKLTFSRKRPHVSAWVNHRHEGFVMLDTGVQGSLHVDPEFARANKSLLQSTSRTTTEAIGVGGSTMLYPGKFKHFYVLATRFDHFRVGVPRLTAQPEVRGINVSQTPREIEGRTVVKAKPLIGNARPSTVGILGGRILKRFRLTFDYRNDRLLVEPVKEPTSRAGRKADAIDFLGWPTLVLVANDGDLPGVDQLIARRINVNAVNREGNSALRIACEGGDARIIASLLVAGADPNVINKRGEAAIHLVAEAGNGSLLRVLIQHGAKTDIKADNGATPLRLASQNGHLTVVKLLLGQKAKVDEPDSAGQSPLMAAAANGHSDTALALLEAGADINHRDDLKQTPLMFAAQAGQVSVANVMLARGADVNAVSRAGLTALRLAKEHGHGALVTLLRKHGAVR